MEDQHFLDSDNLKVENERPTFLTVLCIITFVVSGIMLISLAYSSVNYSVENQIEANELEIINTIKLAEMFSGGQDLPELDAQIEMMELRQAEELEHHTVLTLINFASVILSLIGAFFMYRLRKLGFHLYTLSKIIALVPLTILTLTSSVIWLISVGVFISGVFILMYSRNLKYMK